MASSVNIGHQGGRIAVNPTVSQFDKKVRIQVSGLDHHAKVTVQAWTHSHSNGKEFVLVSHGHFYTDGHGMLDPDTDPSLGGSYTGVDAMGLLWSLAPLPSHLQNVRLVIRDVTKPMLVKIAVFSGHITPDDDTLALEKVKPLSITSLERRIMAPGVKRIEIRKGQIRGTLFLPSGGGVHPGVIDLFGATGGIIEARAALLAASGFAALSLAFFRYQDLPKTLEEVQFDYFEIRILSGPSTGYELSFGTSLAKEAVSWLSSHPLVKPGGIGVVGVSAGGSLSMLMAIHCPQVIAAVNINGPPYQIFCDLLRNGKMFYPSIRMEPSRAILVEKEGYISYPIYVTTDADFFPVWKSQAQILFLCGEDDKQFLWKDAVKLRELCPEQNRHQIDVVVYPGAGHLLEVSNTPHCRSSYFPKADENILWGGHCKSHAMAQIDAWNKTLSFLNAWVGGAKTVSRL